MIRVMANERLKFAIGRLERAAARVERILTNSQTLAATPGKADLQLGQRHELLRQHVRSAISRIDTLIGSAR